MIEEDPHSKTVAISQLVLWVRVDFSWPCPPGMETNRNNERTSGSGCTFAGYCGGIHPQRCRRNFEE